MSSARPGPRRFTFAFTDSYRPTARLFGITPATASVSLDPLVLTARFGPWTLTTTVANIAYMSLTGPYRYFKTAGPARLSLSDRGLTFATNNRQGVYLQFREPVPGIDPFGMIKHPNLTVTVSECAELIAALGDAKPS